MSIPKLYVNAEII